MAIQIILPQLKNPSKGSMMKIAIILFALCCSGSAHAFTDLVGIEGLNKVCLLRCLWDQSIQTSDTFDYDMAKLEVALCSRTNFSGRPILTNLCGDVASATMYNNVVGEGKFEHAVSRARVVCHVNASIDHRAAGATVYDICGGWRNTTLCFLLYSGGAGPLNEPFNLMLFLYAGMVFSVFGSIWCFGKGVEMAWRTV